MKIDTAIPQPVAARDRTRNRPPAAQEGARPENQDDAFNVKLTSLRERNPLQGDDDEIRRAKVAAIRDQLAAGSYNISGKDVADKILEALKN